MFSLNYAWNELRRRWGRTLVTALGLAAGVGLVMGIIGVSNGLSAAQNKVLSPLGTVGTDIIVTRTVAPTTSTATTTTTTPGGRAARRRRLLRAGRRRVFDQQQRGGATREQLLDHHGPREAREAGDEVHPRLLRERDPDHLPFCGRDRRGEDLRGHLSRRCALPPGAP